MYTIKEMAEMAGVSACTLRYYDTKNEQNTISTCL